MRLDDLQIVKLSSLSDEEALTFILDVRKRRRLVPSIPKVSSVPLASIDKLVSAFSPEDIAHISQRLAAMQRKET